MQSKTQRTVFPVGISRCSGHFHPPSLTYCIWNYERQVCFCKSQQKYCHSGWLGTGLGKYVLSEKKDYKKVNFQKISIQLWAIRRMLDITQAFFGMLFAIFMILEFLENLSFCLFGTEFTKSFGCFVVKIFCNCLIFSDLQSQFSVFQQEFSGKIWVFEYLRDLIFFWKSGTEFF